MTQADRAPAHESRLYAELSPLYDRVFTRIFAPRLQRTVTLLRIPPGARVLEVGVGTGLSLEAYPHHCRVTGIDLAPDMLARARDKIARQGWRHLEVMEMDAQNLAFADDSFDYATAFHVISVVPDARRLLREVVRVTRPGATIAIVNHFRSRHRILATLDRLFEPVSRRLGWITLDRRTVFEDLPVEVLDEYKTSPTSLFTILLLRNTKTTPAA